MSSRSFIGFTEEIDAAVLSVMIATVFGLRARRASATFISSGSDCSACEPAVAEVWKTYLKPRSVIRSE